MAYDACTTRQLTLAWVCSREANAMLASPFPISTPSRFSSLSSSPTTPSSSSLPPYASVSAWLSEWYQLHTQLQHMQQRVAISSCLQIPSTVKGQQDAKIRLSTCLDTCMETMDQYVISELMLPSCDTPFLMTYDIHESMLHDVSMCEASPCPSPAIHRTPASAISDAASMCIASTTASTPSSASASASATPSPSSYTTALLERQQSQIITHIHGLHLIRKQLMQQMKCHTTSPSPSPSPSRITNSKLQHDLKQLHHHINTLTARHQQVSALRQRLLSRTSISASASPVTSTLSPIPLTGTPVDSSITTPDTMHKLKSTIASLVSATATTSASVSGVETTSTTSTTTITATPTPPPTITKKVDSSSDTLTVIQPRQLTFLSPPTHSHAHGNSREDPKSTSTSSNVSIPAAATASAVAAAPVAQPSTPVPDTVTPATSSVDDCDSPAVETLLSQIMLGPRQRTKQTSTQQQSRPRATTTPKSRSSALRAIAGHSTWSPSDIQGTTPSTSSASPIFRPHHEDPAFLNNHNNLELSIKLARRSM